MIIWSFLQIHKEKKQKIRIFLKTISINLSFAFNEKQITWIWSKCKIFRDRWVFSLTNIILANTVQKLTCDKSTLVQYVPLYGNKFDQYNGFVLVVFKIETYGYMIYFCVFGNQHKQRNFKNKNRIIVYLSNDTDVWASDGTAQIYQYLDN